MLRTLKHVVNVAHNALRESAKRGSKIAQVLTGEPPRSPEWPAVEKKHLKEEPNCKACNGKDHLNVHHKVSFKHDPKLELDDSNLITLCMGALECHLLIGHGDNFQYYNPNVAKDAAEVMTAPTHRPLVEARAKASRVKS